MDFVAGVGVTERWDVGVDDLRFWIGRVSWSDSDTCASFGSESAVSSSDAAAGRAEEDRAGGGDDLSGEVGAAVNVEVLLVACRRTAANLRGSEIALGAGRSTVLEEAVPLATCLSLAISRFNASSSTGPSSASSSSPAPRPPREVIHPVAEVENRFRSALDGDSLGSDRSEARAESDEAKRAANEGASESG